MIQNGNYGRPLMIVCRTARTERIALIQETAGQTAPRCGRDSNQEIHMMMKSIVRALVLGLALLPLASMAAQGQLRSQKTYGDWVSAIFHINNTDKIRLTTNEIGYRNSFLVLDIDSSGYEAKLITEKTDSEIGSVVSSDPVELNCELRIDTNPVFYVNCSFNDNNTASFLVFGQGLNSRFIDEMKSGSILRVKLQVGDKSYYDKYSLRGFTRSFNRGMSLMYGSGNSGYYGGGNDSDYFR